MLRCNAFEEAKTYLESVNDLELNIRNKRLKKLLIDIIDGTETKLDVIESFVLPNDGRAEKGLANSHLLQHNPPSRCGIPPPCNVGLRRAQDRVGHP